MTTVVTGRHFRPGFFCVEMIATNAVEGDFSSLRIIKFSVAAIVIKPQRAKHPENQDTIKNYIEGKIWRSNHVEIPQDVASNAKGK